MQCIRPIKGGYDFDGNITFDRKKHNKELIGFTFPCGKCLACRLKQAREKSVRAVHEAKMYEENIFLTLTYSEDHLKSPTLQYTDFQAFMKRLRKKITQNITCPDLRKELRVGYMVTGEYGELNKRPHWHAIIFNYRPSDSTYKYTTDIGETVYDSNELSEIWGKGNIEFGTVTMDSAGYVARYATKKLVHGHDQEHNFHPIHRTSCRTAMGKKWIEEYYEQTFNHGYILIPGTTEKTAIPRYYIDWAKKHKPETYIRYVTQTREQIIKASQEKNRKEELEHLSTLLNYQPGASYPLTRNQVKTTILNLKFKKLQENLKL